MLISTWFISLWIFCCAIFLCLCGEQSHKRVCYFHNWAQYRQGTARYTVPNAGLQDLCTHLVYAYAHFDAQGKLQPAFGDAEFSVYAQFNALKDHSPEDLKTLIAVGGWNFGSSKFSVLAGDPTSRARFVTNAVTFLRQHGFDGLELNWESPGSRGGTPEDRENLALLCKELKAAFEAEAPGSRKRLILSASAPASPELMDVGYDIRALDSCLDLWTLRTYAFHGAWEGVTGHGSPLYAASNVTETQASASVEWTAEEYVRRGASRQKVMVGLSTSGTAFRLTSSWRHSPGSPASLGPAGPLTKEPGFWAYYEVCQRISDGSGVVRRDVKQRVPYYVDGDLWISYEDEESIAEKTNWLKQNGYGGFALRALDTDVFDPARLCVSSSSSAPLSPYPLLSAATSTLLSPSTSTTSASSQRQEGESGTMESSTQRSSGAGRSDPETATAAPGAPETGSQTGSGSRIGSQTGSETGGGGSRTGASGSRTGGSGFQSGESGSRTGGSGSQKGFPCEGRPYTTYGDPSSPCRYVVCWANVPHYKTCPSGEVFHQDLRACYKPQQPAPC